MKGSDPETQIPTILLGKKPLSTYLAACFEIIDAHETGKAYIWIEGMGRNIVKVIDLYNFLKRFLTRREVKIANFQVDMIPRKELHGLPKHVSKLRVLVEISPTSTKR